MPLYTNRPCSCSLEAPEEKYWLRLGTGPSIAFIYFALCGAPAVPKPCLPQGRCSKCVQGHAQASVHGDVMGNSIVLFRRGVSARALHPAAHGFALHPCRDPSSPLCAQTFAGDKPHGYTQSHTGCMPMCAICHGKLLCLVRSHLTRT